MPEYHGWTHAPKAQGGTDPVPFTGETSVVHLDSWNYDTDNTVATATWTPVANFDGGAGFFEETWYTASPGMTWDYQTGTITLVDDAEYVLHAWVQFNEDAQVDNESRIIALNFGSSDRVIAKHIFDTADGTIAQLKLPVTAHRVIGFGSGTVQLEVWHNAGSDLTIRDAELLARKFELVSSLTLDENDPFA